MPKFMNRISDYSDRGARAGYGIYTVGNTSIVEEHLKICLQNKSESGLMSNLSVNLADFNFKVYVL